MSTFQLQCHIMPWNIDHFLFLCDTLKKSFYHLSGEDKIVINTTLNLSSKIVDWDKSKLPKEFFIEKYYITSNLLNDYTHNLKVYEGDEVYGHLDTQKECYNKEADYYIAISPNISFSEYLLFYMMEYAKQIENEYFILTPQIFKGWDASWDVLVNDRFKDIPYTECIDHDIHKIRSQTSNLDTPEILPLNQFKYAGWLDLYNKAFYEKLAPTPEDWKGYGPWDSYSIKICYMANQAGVDVKQYLLKNEVIWFYETGTLKNKEVYGTDGQFKMLYQNYLELKLGKSEQRSYIEDNMEQYLHEWG